MNIQPLGDRVVIKPLKAAETTSAGIYIPQTGSAERPQEGEIVAIGPGKTMDDGSVRAIFNDDFQGYILTDEMDFSRTGQSFGGKFSQNEQFLENKVMLQCKIKAVRLLKAYVKT